MDAEQAARIIRESPLSDRADELIGRLRPSVHLHAERVDLERLEVGASRLAGVPDVPEGFEWPENQGEPLAFLAQVNLAEVARLGDFGAPDRGWLLYFVDLAGFEPWRVMHLRAEPGELRRAVPPVTMPPQSPRPMVRFFKRLLGRDVGVMQPPLGRFHPCAVRMEATVTLPDWDESARDEALDSFDAYCDLLEALGCGGNADGHHRMFGHAQTIQGDGDPRAMVQLATSGREEISEEALAAAMREPGARDWRLLMQIDSDWDGPGWNFADGGRFYFWIKKQELARGDLGGIFRWMDCY